MSIVPEHNSYGWKELHADIEYTNELSCFTAVQLHRDRTCWTTLAYCSEGVQGICDV